MSSRNTSANKASTAIPTTNKQQMGSSGQTLAATRSKRLNIGLTQKAQFIDETEERDEQEYRNGLAAKKGRKPPHTDKENLSALPPAERNQFTTTAVPSTRTSNPTPAITSSVPTATSSTSSSKILPTRNTRVPPAPLHVRGPSHSGSSQRSSNSGRGRKHSSPEVAARVNRLNDLRDPFVGPSAIPRAPADWRTKSPTQQVMDTRRAREHVSGRFAQEEYDEMDEDPNADRVDDEVHELSARCSELNNYRASRPSPNDTVSPHRLHTSSGRNSRRDDEDDVSASDSEQISPQSQRVADLQAQANRIQRKMAESVDQRSSHPSAAVTPIRRPRTHMASGARKGSDEEPFSSRQDHRTQSSEGERISHQSRDAEVGDKRTRSDTDHPPPRKAQKTSRSKSRAKAGDYEQSVQVVIYTAWSCFEARITCYHAYPDAITETKWAKVAWEEACEFHDVNIEETPEIIRLIRNRAAHLRGDLKQKARNCAQAVFGVEQSARPSIIKANKRVVKELKTDKGFYYRVCRGNVRQGFLQNRGIQQLANSTYYRHGTDLGIIAPEGFSPFPPRGIALILTALEAAVDEWDSGSFTKTVLHENHYKQVYATHWSNIQDFCDRPGGEAMLQKICESVEEGGRFHAGVSTEDNGTESTLPADVFDAAIEEFNKTGLFAEMDHDNESTSETEPAGMPDVDRNVRSHGRVCTDREGRPEPSRSDSNNDSSASGGPRERTMDQRQEADDQEDAVDCPRAGAGVVRVRRGRAMVEDDEELE